MDEVERIAKERRPKLLLAGWSAYPRILDFERFRAIADAVGALPDGRHGPLRRARRRRRAPEPGPVRRRGHEHGPQDARRRTRRPDPVPRGVREEDQLRRLPRPAGRPARARHRGQGRRVPDRRDRRSSASARSAPSRAPGPSPPSCSRPAHGVNVLTGGTDVHLVLVDLRDSELDGQQAEDRLHDDRHHRQPQRGAVRPAPAGGLLRPARRRLGAGDPRPPGRRLRGGRADHRHGAPARLRRRRRRSWPSA